MSLLDEYISKNGSSGLNKKVVESATSTQQTQQTKNPSLLEEYISKNGSNGLNQSVVNSALGLTTPENHQAPTKTPATDVQTWGSEPWKTVETPSMFSGTTQLTVTPAPTENEKRIKELQAQLEQIKQNAAYDLTGEHDWATDRKKVEDELRSLGDTSVDRASNVLGGWLNRTGGSYLNVLSTLGQRYATYSDKEKDLLSKLPGMQSEDAKERADEYFSLLDDRAKEIDEGLGTKATSLIDTGNAKIETAKQGLTNGEQLGVDLALGALDLGADAVANAIVPGSGRVLMASRVFGQSAAEAKAKGLSLDQQTLAGLKDASIEILSEMIIGGPYDAIYGKGAFDDVVEKGIQKLAKTEAGRRALRLGTYFLGENFEEMFSGVVGTLTDKWFKLDPEAEIDWSEVVYEGFVGGLLGLAGGAVNPQTWNSMTPAQKAQVVQQAADNAIEQSGVTRNAEGKAAWANKNEAYYTSHRALNVPARGYQQTSSKLNIPQSTAAVNRNNAAESKATPAETVQQIINDATRPKAPSVAEQIVNDAVNGTPHTAAQNAARAQAQQGDITTAHTQQNASMDAPVELNSQSTQNGQQAGEIATDESGFTGKVVDTQNAYADANGMESGTHVQHSDAEVNSRADAMLSEKGADGVMAELANRKDGSTYAWSDVDTRTAQKAMDTVRAEMAKVKETDPQRYLELAKKLGDFKGIYEKAGTNNGRSMRQRGIFNNTPADIVAEAARVLTGKEFIAMRNDLTEVGKVDLLDTVDKYSAQLETFENKRDTESIIEMIKDLSAQRRTTAFQGKLWGKGEKNLINSMLERAANMPDGAEYLGNLAGQQIKGLVYDQKQAGWINQGKSIRYMWMLSSPKSIMNNISGNSVMGLLVDPASNNIGFLFDSLMSKVTGTREVAFDRGIFSKAAIEGMDEAATKSFLEVALDVDTSASKYTGKSGRTFKMSGNVIERFFSTLEMLQGFAYNTTDAVAKGIAAGETTRGLNQLRESGKTNLNIKEAAEQTAKYRTLQEDNAVTDAMLKLRNSADNFIGIGNEQTGRFGVGNAVMPFGKTGANAVKVSAIDLNPLMVGKAALSIKNVLQAKKNGTLTPGMQRTAALQMGRALNGTSLLLLSMSLAAKGVIRWHNDDNKDKNALESALGKEGLQINLSAALRGLIGEDTEERADDLVTELDFAPELNAYATMGFMLNEARADGKVTAKEFIGADAYAVAGALKEFPSFSQVTRILNAAKYAETDDSMSETEKMAAKVEAGAKTLGSDVLTSFLVPNLARNVASGLDSTERELYTGDIRENTINQVRAAIPGEILGIGRETLPAKLDNWGNEIINEGGFQNFLNKNFLPASLTRIKHDPTSEAILGLAEASGDNSIIPDRKPPKSVTYDGEKHEMSIEEQRAYQKKYGDTYRSIIEDVLGIRSYKGYDAATQAAVMKEAESLAKDTAKGDYLVDSGTAKANDVATKADDMKKTETARYVVAKAGYAEAKGKGNYDLIDEIISGQFSRLSGKAVDALGDNGKEMAKINEAMKDGLSSSKNYFKAQEAMSGNDSNAKFDEVQSMAIILPDRDVDAMAKSTLSENQYAFYSTARDVGMKPSEIVKKYKGMLNENGKTTQATVGAVLKTFEDRCTGEQLQTMWEALTNGKTTYSQWRAKNR